MVRPGGGEAGWSVIYTFPESSHLPRAAAHRATGRWVPSHGLLPEPSQPGATSLQKHPEISHEPKALRTRNRGGGC